MSRIAEEIDALDRRGVHWNDILTVLRRISDAETLWTLVPYLAPSLPVARMVYRRAIELNASEDRARGYLATIHGFFADDETAAAITGQQMPSTRDTELLLAWASLDWEADRHIARLQSVLPHADNLRRVWGAIASTASRTGRDAVAVDAYRWLIAHETDEKERNRFLSIVRERGWSI